MEPKRLVGPGAGSVKYDLLTALAVVGLHGPPVLQVSMARLSALITARYNWKLDHFCVGQPEMARLWNVTERTVKREIKRWTDDQLLICTRRGVRGRVGAYRLNMVRIFEISAPFWPAVGTDYAERMQALNPVQTSSVVKVEFGRPAEPRPILEMTPAKGTWPAVSARLKSLYPEQYPNWFAPLNFVSDTGVSYTLSARSGFVVRYVETHFINVIAEAVQAEVGPGRRIILNVEAEGRGGG